MTSNLFLVDVKRKLESQDIFRAKTVRALVEQIDSLIEQRDALRQRAEQAEADAGRLREALQKIAAGNPAKPPAKWLSDIEMAEIARAALSQKGAADAE